MIALIVLADLRVAFDNDYLSHFDAKDDDGFTNDIDVRFYRPHGDYLIGGELFDRWVTEEPRSAGGRRDLLELVATGERTWGVPSEGVTLGVRVGPAFTGNLGGRWGQNAFHTVCGCGQTLDQGLQARYDGHDEAGAVAGGHARGSYGLPWVQAYGAANAQASAFTGVDFVDLAGGADVILRTGATEVGLHAELAAMRFHVVDDGLALSGGYRAGWQSAYRFGFYVARAWFRFEYEFRSNEGNGEPIGVIAFTFKQAGTSF